MVRQPGIVPMNIGEFRGKRRIDGQPGVAGLFGGQDFHGSDRCAAAVCRRIAVATLTLSDSTAGFCAMRTIWSQSVRVSLRMPVPSEPMTSAVAR